MTWHAGRILNALARHFDWQRNFLMPEWEIGGRADLVVITPARYLTEIEIKVSVADWRADAKKGKWLKEPRGPFANEMWEQWERKAHAGLLKQRESVSRFFYAIPETLEEKVPELLPEGVGILVVRATADRRYAGNVYLDSVHTIREAVRRKSKPVSEAEFHRIMVACYYRYWRTLWDLERFRRDRKQMRELTGAAR